jgi:soluble cytochrome b562
MPLFKKKEVKSEEDSFDLPELPELPELPKLSSQISGKDFSRQHSANQEPAETKSLPSFPYTSMGEDLSQEAIKSAVVRQPEKFSSYKEKSLDFPKRETKPFESISSAKLSPQVPKFAPVKSYSPQSFSRLPALKGAENTEPVYVRLDKYKSAVTNFQEIQHKILEIDSLLKQIREEKRKEEEELSSWEEKIEMLKERIDAIDRNIFSKLD